jgi:hypothetical protein
MTIKQEIDARIVTQLALRESSNKIKKFRNEICHDLKEEISRRKYSRKNSVINYCRAFDENYKGSLIAKIVSKSLEQKTSKHQLHQWFYLFYDFEKPYTRREEHLIEVRSTEMNTKRPDNYYDGSMGVYISRHFLERTTLRLKCDTLEDMISGLKHHVAFASYSRVKKQCLENNGMVFLTLNEYIILESIDEEYIIFKTIVPKKDWSSTRLKLLSPILESLEKKETLDNEIFIATIDIDNFNTNKTINLNNVDYHHSIS